jgi:hypothetical protein
MILVIIEVAISLIVIYFLLSTLVSFVNELIAMLLNSRGNLLFKSIKMLFANDAIVDKLFKSEQIKDLATLPSINGWFNKISDKKKPEYISADNFSSSLLETIFTDTNQSNLSGLNYNKLINKIDNIQDGALKNKLIEITTILNESKQESIENLKKKIEEWYNIYMGEISVIYKNSTKIFIFIISFFITIVFNIDSIKLIKYFYNQPAARQIMMSYTENNIINKDTTSTFNFKSNQNDLLDSSKIAEFNSKKDKLINDIYSFNLPIAQQCIFKEFGNGNGLQKVIGYLLTIVSLTLGAPFWYQVLMKLINAKNNISNNS